jgi:hypothetical protein
MLSGVSYVVSYCHDKLVNVRQMYVIGSEVVYTLQMLEWGRCPSTKVRCDICN